MKQLYCLSQNTVFIRKLLLYAQIKFVACLNLNTLDNQWDYRMCGGNTRKRKNKNLSTIPITLYQKVFNEYYKLWGVLCFLEVSNCGRFVPSNVNVLWISLVLYVKKHLIKIQCRGLLSHFQYYCHGMVKRYTLKYKQAMKDTMKMNFFYKHNPSL